MATKIATHLQWIVDEQDNIVGYQVANRAGKGSPVMLDALAAAIIAGFGGGAKPTIALHTDAGSVSSPVGPVLGGGNTASGRFNLSVPWLKIPANSTQPGDVIVVDQELYRTGTGASIFTGPSIGPANATSDPSMGQVTLATGANPNKASVQWRCLVGPSGTAEVSARGSSSLGAIFSQGEIAFDRTIDNFISLVGAGFNYKAQSATAAVASRGTGYTTGDVLMISGGTPVVGPAAITFTGALSGATSGTLNANWTSATGSYAMLFSDGSVRLVTLTLNATTATWTGAVTATANATASSGAVMTASTVVAGAITALSVSSQGNYTAPPTNYDGTVTLAGGTGTGCTPNVVWTGDTLSLLGISAKVESSNKPSDVFNLVASPIYVPKSFFGLNSYTWPISGSAPLINFGTYSCFGNPKTHWGWLQTSANAFNANIVDLDTVVNTNYAAGVETNLCFYSCPSAFATTGSGTAGPWGRNGEGAFPNDLTQVTWFLTNIINRYNTATVKKITSIQLWNEPDFKTTPGANSGWWGTPAQFVDLLWTAYTAIKAADPSIRVLGPGTYQIKTGTANDGALDQWLTTAGTTFPTKTGKDCFDDVAAHPYHALPFGKLYAGFGDIQGLAQGGIQNFKQLLSSVGKSGWNYYVTEWGVSSSYDAELVKFLQQTAAFRKTFIARLLIDAALSGVKFFSCFGFGQTAILSGDLVNDTTGVIAGWNEAFAAMAGKTIGIGGVMPDGSRKLWFTDGTTYAV